MLHCFLDHVAIIFADLTWFNVFSTLVSFVAVIATIWAARAVRAKKNDNDESDIDEKLLKFGIQARFKVAKQKLIERDFTPEQLAKEKEYTSEALQVILKVLQERKDIFPSPTMDELKEQMSLYRAQ